jgi:predicted small metal-binding protein
MKMLSCREAGVDCDFVARGNTVEEVMKSAAEHGRQKHGMTSIPPDLQQKMRSLIREEKQAV